jgi:hypothetical protein
MLVDPASEPQSSAEVLAVELEEARAKITQLERALGSHAVVNQARGVLMTVHKISAEAAWDAMSRVSSHRNIKLRVVAETILHLMTSDQPPRTGDPAVEAVLRDLLPSRGRQAP